MLGSSQESRAAIVVVSGVPQQLAYTYSPGVTPLAVGSEVVVEIGSRQAKGYVVNDVPLAEAIEQFRLEREAEPSIEKQLTLLDVKRVENGLKPILSAQRAFQPEQLQLFQWMSQYYGVSLAEVIENALPKRSDGRVLKWISLSQQFATSIREDPETLVQLQKRSPTQARVLNEISLHPEGMTIADLELRVPGARAAIGALRKKGAIEERQVPAYLASLQRPLSDEPAGAFASPTPNTLTPAQSTAVERISQTLEKGAFAPLLLFGVTGSGKTEVYLRAIEQVLSSGGSALVVVPEIALTPQLVDQFQSRLRRPMALLHSQVGTSERWGAWEALLSGELRLAIGARSAIFAPLKNLRLIIVDEEHENSYKQSDGFRYHGRDIAVMRAKFASCPVVLGSATPSFESLLNASRGRYDLIEMPERVTTRPLPQLEVVDLSKKKRSEMISPNISPELHLAITETLERQGQVVILYNRRGFSSYLQCDTCSQVLLCPNCSVALTYHRRSDRLVCHYCDLSRTPPLHCVFCRDPRLSRIETDDAGAPVEKPKKVEAVGKLEHRGGGTERVVDELATLFPDKTILRMDRDTVGQKDSYRQILGDMRSGEADILVGTQMVAKGHDLPGVTLVGIINADVGLHLPDFRASEKSYQLITQAAGRAGRGKEQGRVIMQTNEPNHPTVVATATGRFKAFARFELEFRKKLGYPPWGRLMRLIISSSDRQDASRAAEMVCEKVSELVQGIQASVAASGGEKPREVPRITILGPSVAPHEKLLARYRFHILVKSNSAKSISALAADLNRWRKTVRGFKDFRLAVDVDPVEML